MMEYNFLKIQEKLLSKIIKIKFFNRKNVKWENVKWEKSQMGKMSNGKNVKWENLKCQKGMSNGNVKWEMSNEKCQIGRMSNGIFPIFKLIKLIFYC